ncbi:conserved hypothetical protein [Candidatus Koribacter versatilis Ellin345]|uniref:DUF2252 domain-containing protein n=1 Tax=Koribacter versatilis (strain Ellin345) TaxID=204669 RepID=Q1ILB9_KORVE|nr:DUF2252 family protein [Candidatus Koribacter versatilis]ABF42331.1 conserved hypothetical protein [Candidatus Koribacter versatilis Ellin345]
MNILQASREYEHWLAKQTDLIAADIRRKHAFMAQSVFPFFRATFYRWLQLWPSLDKAISGAPKVLAVGDLHVENFGTWRDGEGRLAWGINDFDEAWLFPYTMDLVRLATSALLAKDAEHLAERGRLVAEAILEGYHDALEHGGKPFVLAEGQDWLRAIAAQQLKDPNAYWDKLTSWPEVRLKNLPQLAKDRMTDLLPPHCDKPFFVARQAGLGSRGHQRYVAIAHWKGGWVAREAKALVPSAAAWIAGTGRDRIYYNDILENSVRDHDPYFNVHEHWLVRRLAPDCTKIPITDLPTRRDEHTLLYCMGYEVANVHLGTKRANAAIAQDLKKRKARWLYDAARDMRRLIRRDFAEWRTSRTRPAK